MTQIIPVISDLQVPFHDKRAVAAVASMIADYEPTTVACVGDVLDCTEISRWARGNALEHAGNLAKSRDTARQVLVDLGVTDLVRSNHDDRIEKYVSSFAPGLATLPELTIESVLGLGPDDLDIRFHRKPYVLAPGWLLMHGDEAGSNRTPGGTALGLARRAGKSVVSGHTHKLGLQHDHPTLQGRVQRDIWGFEVGNLMDMSKASYLSPMGYANWQSGFGVLVVDGNDVFPVPCPIKNGRFTFDGFIWRG
jgi:hypothetical protein